MKAKRVWLHVCISVLAIICMSACMYIAYYESTGYYEDQQDYYIDSYSEDVKSVLNYGYMENTLRTKYSDADKILIEDKKRGNVTVKDVWEIFKDKYSYYFESGTYTNYSDWEEFQESWEYAELDTGTLYEIDYDLMKTYKKQWKKDKTNKDLKDEYTYYSKKCELVDEYAYLVEQLLWGMGENGEIINDIDINALLGNAYPSVNYGLVYYIEYKIGGMPYVISNVGNEKYFEKDGVIDLLKKENSKLVQEKPPYGYLELENLPLHANEFLEVVDKFYTAIDTSQPSIYSEYIQKIENQLTDEEVEVVKKREIACIAIVVITLITAFVLFVILMIIAGHREKDDKASLYRSDKLWLDVIVAVVTVIVGCGLAVFIYFFEGGYGQEYVKVAFIGAVVSTISIVETVLFTSESFSRRLKTKSLIDTTLLGKIIKLAIRVLKRVKVLVLKLWENINLTWKVVVLGIAFLTFELFNSFLSYQYGLEGVILQIAIATVLICGLVWLYFDENKKIKEGAKKIAQGDIDYKIEEEMKFSVNESLKDSVNSIGDGLNGAVIESIKNERMKTELIANVSHDLKTPLTSIINYVDLLKNEGLDSENAAKYLEVLDKKSQRLKHLTEDLVEVSKLNSGAVSLRLEKIDIVQLVKQSLGEYAEKFQERKLQVIKTIQQEPIYVMADGSKTWRLFENLYQNVYKYAMPGTRVYIDIKQEYGKAVVSVKNISEGPLNFSADELMERFVRGDVSRTTEGSGLGLSIARSIAERQNGNMNIVLDGDLFKVEIEMNLINQ